MQADLGQVPAAQAVSALVAAGVAVSSAAPRNRLEDVFLAMVDASGAAGSSTDYPAPGTGPAGDGIGGAGDGASPAAGPGVGERTPVSSTRQGGQS